MNVSLVQLVGNSIAYPSEEQHVRQLDSSAICAVELGVVTKRVGGSSRCWCGEFVMERKLELSDKTCAELHLSVAARAPSSPTGLVDIPGDQSKLNDRQTVAHEERMTHRARPCHHKLWNRHIHDCSTVCHALVKLTSWMISFKF